MGQAGGVRECVLGGCVLPGLDPGSTTVCSRGPGVRGPWASPSGNSVSVRMALVGGGLGVYELVEWAGCSQLPISPDPLLLLLPWQLHGE